MFVQTYLPFPFFPSLNECRGQEDPEPANMWQSRRMFAVRQRKCVDADNECGLILMLCQVRQIERAPGPQQRVNNAKGFDAQGAHSNVYITIQYCDSI